MTSGAVGLSATQAARALAELPHYEETLTAKAFGITLMAFGIASAAIGMTYHTSAPWLVGAGLEWLFSFLWMPWIAAATVLTGTVWQSQAVSLGVANADEPKGSWWYAVMFSGLYLVLFAAANLVRVSTPWSAADGVLNLYVLAWFTLLLSLFFSWRHQAGAMMRPLMWASFGIAAAAIAGDVGDLRDGIDVLYGAGVTLVAYVGAGVLIARRG